jgi:hypothetical protein
MVQVIVEAFFQYSSTGKIRSMSKLHRRGAGAPAFWDFDTTGRNGV